MKLNLRIYLREFQFHCGKQLEHSRIQEDMVTIVAFYVALQDKNNTNVKKQEDTIEIAIIVMHVQIKR